MLLVSYLFNDFPGEARIYLKKIILTTVICTSFYSRTERKYFNYTNLRSRDLNDSGIITMPSKDSIFSETHDAVETTYDELDCDFRDRVQTAPNRTGMQNMCKIPQRCQSETQLGRNHHDGLHRIESAYNIQERRVPTSFNQEAVYIDVPTRSTSSFHITKEIAGKQEMAVTINFKIDSTQL